MAAKIKTRRWDPAEHIAVGEDVLVYLQTITPEEYDPDTTPFFLDCIARSKGVAQIAGVAFHQTDRGVPAVTVATAGGARATIAMAPAVSPALLQQTLAPGTGQQTTARRAEARI